MQDLTPTLTERTALRFSERFGGVARPRFAMAPGRVNLIGEHTDYNQGFVLPMAIDRHVVVAFAESERSVARVYSEDYHAGGEILPAALTPPGGSSWLDYVAGVFWALTDAGYRLRGADVVLAGDVPQGAGLGSSAALELGIARALAAASSLTWDGVGMARIAQRAENDFVGVSCGIMDQLAAAISRPGHAMLLDCRTLQPAFVPIPAEAAVVIMDTGTRRSLADGLYNERRQRCERAVSILKSLSPSIHALRDVSVGLLERTRREMDDVTFHRAAHVVQENTRARDMAEALAAGDLERAGRLMNASHASLRDQFEVSSPELDAISAIARSRRGCWGARMTGAGFGGCAVALVENDVTARFLVEVERRYRQDTGRPGALFVASPVSGARLL